MAVQDDASKRGLSRQIAKEVSSFSRKVTDVVESLRADDITELHEPPPPPIMEMPPKPKPQPKPQPPKPERTKKK
jgi:hypothetical protein